MSKRKGNKPASIFIFIIAVLVIGVSAYLLAENSKTENSNANTSKIALFFVGENGIIKEEEREIKVIDDDLLPQKVLEELKNGPKVEGHFSVVPENIIFNSVNVKDGVATIDINGEYNDLKIKTELICRSAIVYSLTDLEFIDYVEITVDNKPLEKNNGQPVGRMSRDNIIIDTNISPEPINTEMIKLYFSNEQATGLTVEEREVEVNPNQPIEKYVVEQLIVGPAKEGLYPTVPAETKIRDIKTVDGICYVDLSQEFVSKHGGGSSGELLTIYSIVNSLSEVSNINKVQFLIEGEKQNEFKGHVDFSKPFEAQIDISI